MASPDPARAPKPRTAGAAQQAQAGAQTRTIPATVAGVTAFLAEQFRLHELEKAAWVRERKALRVAASRLKRDLKSAALDNEHLVRRVAMLEEVLKRERTAHGQPPEAVWDEEAAATAPVLAALRDVPPRAARAPAPEPADENASAEAPALRHRSKRSGEGRRRRRAPADAVHGASPPPQQAQAQDPHPPPPPPSSLFADDADVDGGSDIFSEEEMEAAMAEAFSVVLGAAGLADDSRGGVEDDEDDEDDEDYVDADGDASDGFLRDTPGIAMLEL